MEKYDRRECPDLQATPPSARQIGHDRFVSQPYAARPSYDVAVGTRVLRPGRGLVAHVMRAHTQAGMQTAVRLHGRRDLRSSAEPPPSPAPGEVVLRITAVGLCGSDRHQ